MIIRYPATKREELVEELHGHKVSDPYRFLEDGGSPETKAWIEAQNEVTFAYLEGIPEREAVKRRLTELVNYERYGLPFKKGGRYFWTKNDGLQNQAVLYVAETLDAEPRVLLDPNTFSEDGTVALTGVAASEDGRYLAYSTASGGSDWQEWHVRDIDKGEDLADRIEWSKFSGASWTIDGGGFYYSRYDAPPADRLLQVENYYQKLYFHRLGTPQTEDELVYERKDHKDWGFGGHVTDDGRYLVIHVWSGTHRENRVFFKDLRDAGGAIVELLPEADASYGFAGNVGPVFYFLTDRDAPRHKLIAIELDKPDVSHWKTIVPEAPEALQSASLVGGKLICTYLKDAHTQVKVFSPSGSFESEVALPGLGTAAGFGGRQDDPETFFVFTSFTYPATIFRYDVATGQTTQFRRPNVDFKPEDYETKQVFFKSKDGTRVPMFVTHRRGLSLDGTSPTVLGGYGGFGIPVTPGFSATDIAWLERGGVVAVANLRGGGEYGNSWHDAGRLANKQNVFDDFIAAAEWLIANGFTSAAKLAIRGGSNGGLLVGACLVQRPDLFCVCLPAVGVLDMLRFHKFTIGWGWQSDYGSPDKPEEFEVLFRYSPYHNLREGESYPATLIMTGDHDDRVVPAHSFKFAAALQHAQAGPAPTLIRIETRAGHGAGKPLSMAIEEAADAFTFALWNMEGEKG
jgi:prolyl oligopeptidase